MRLLSWTYWIAAAVCCRLAMPQGTRDEAVIGARLSSKPKARSRAISDGINDVHVFRQRARNPSVYICQAKSPRQKSTTDWRTAGLNEPPAEVS